MATPAHLERGLLFGLPAAQLLGDKVCSILSLAPLSHTRDDSMPEHQVHAGKGYHSLPVAAPEASGKIEPSPGHHQPVVHAVDCREAATHGKLAGPPT